MCHELWGKSLSQPDPVSRLTLGELCYRSEDVILSYCSERAEEVESQRHAFQKSTSQSSFRTSDGKSPKPATPHQYRPSGTCSTSIWLSFLRQTDIRPLLWGHTHDFTLKAADLTHFQASLGVQPKQAQLLHIQASIQHAGINNLYLSI